MNRIEYLKEIDNAISDNTLNKFFDDEFDYEKFLKNYSDRDIIGVVTRISTRFIDSYIRFDKHPNISRIMLDGISLIISELVDRDKLDISKPEHYFRLMECLFSSYIPPLFIYEFSFSDIESYYSKNSKLDKLYKGAIEILMLLNKVYNTYISNQRNISSIISDVRQLSYKIKNLRFLNSILSAITLYVNEEFNDYMIYDQYIRKIEHDGSDCINTTLLYELIPKDRKDIFNSFYIQRFSHSLSYIVYNDHHRLGNKLVKRMSQSDIMHYVNAYMDRHKMAPNITHLKNKSINRILNAIKSDKLKLFHILVVLRENGIKLHFDIFNMNLSSDSIICCNKKKGIYLNTTTHFDRIRAIDEYNKMVDNLSKYGIKLLTLNNKGEYNLSKDELDKKLLIDEYNILVEKLSKFNINLVRLHRDGV